MSQWYSVRLGNEELLVKDSPETLCCVLEQETLFSAEYWFNQGSREMSQHDRKIVDLGMKYQNKQTKGLQGSTWPSVQASS